MRNPFEYGGIVGAESFCNRTEELQFLLRAAENHRKLFITGERRIGKTSLLFRLMEAFEESRFHVAYIDLWRCVDTRDVVEECAAAFGAMGGESPESILERARRFFGSLRPAITVGDDGRPALTFSNVPRKADNPLLNEIMSVPGRLAVEDPSSRYVVIFDEFQQIRQMKDPRIEKILRSEMQKQSEVSYFFCGSRKHILQQMFLSGGSPLYRSAAHYPVEGIPRKHWIPFIRERFFMKDAVMDDDMIHEILTLTQCHPFYTQMLCAVLWEDCSPGGSLEAPMLEAALEKLLKRESGAYHAIWESLPVNARKMLLAVAMEDPLREPSSGSIMMKYGLSSPSSAMTGLEKLIWRDLVEPADDLYRMNDRFMGRWLRTRFAREGAEAE